MKLRYEDLPWKQMAGIRDIVIHDYDEVDIKRIYDTVMQDLPALLMQIQAVLDQMP